MSGIFFWDTVYINLILVGPVWSLAPDSTHPLGSLKRYPNVLKLSSWIQGFLLLRGGKGEMGKGKWKEQMDRKKREKRGKERENGRRRKEEEGKKEGKVEDIRVEGRKVASWCWGGCTPLTVNHVKQNSVLVKKNARQRQFYWHLKYEVYSAAVTCWTLSFR